MPRVAHPAHLEAAWNACNLLPSCWVGGVGSVRSELRSQAIYHLPCAWACAYLAINQLASLNGLNASSHGQDLVGPGWTTSARIAQMLVISISPSLSPSASRWSCGSARTGLACGSILIKCMFGHFSGVIRPEPWVNLLKGFQLCVSALTTR